jgi:glycine hydroxymethyltransferase
MLISRTGYTGEPLGYEIYVGETDAAWLWERLINAGSPLGLLPCGLAARDSTRTEAGLPLYGHELSGGHSVNPFEAGFGSYVKLHKPFFVGRSHCANSYREQQREIVRFSVESGARPVRETSAVLDRNGIVLGRVTSCVSLGDSQVGLALLERRGIHPGAPISLLNPPRQGLFTGATEPLQTGDRIGTPSRGTILSRFMERDETPGSAKRE